jgi:DNA-binding response OmpR family regulator
MNKTSSIFLVEDEALIAMQLRDELEELGYHVCGHAAKGEAALDQIPKKQPDLALMDINLMGSLTGIDTARRLGERTDVPVVFLSAYADPEMIANAVSTGPFGYLVKPFNPRELHATIEVALQKHRTEKALRHSNRECEERVVKLRGSGENIPPALRGVMVCSSCRKVHAGLAGWEPFEQFTARHALDRFAHAVCPECVAGAGSAQTDQTESGS